MSLPVFLRTLHSIGLPWHGLIKRNTSGTSCTLTRNSDAVVMTMPTALYAYPDAWRLKADGIGVASTPAAITAAGGEYRNEALQPNASRGYPVFFDEDDKPWVIANRTIEVVSGDVEISMQLRPFGVFGDGIDYTSTATVSATVSGLTGLDTDGVGHLASMSLNGRKQIWTILERDDNPIDFTPTLCLGIVEITLSGSGTFTTWPGTLSGLSVTATVLKTTEECAWEITDEVNDVDADDCHQLLTQQRIFHAWYDDTDSFAIKYLTHGRTIEDTQVATNTGTYPLGPTSWTFDATLSWSEFVTDGTHTITSDAFTRTTEMSGSNNGSDYEQTSQTVYRIGATEIATVNETQTCEGCGGDIGGASVSCTAIGAFSEIVNPWTLVYDGTIVMEDGVHTTYDVATRFFAQRVRLISNNLVGIFQGCGEMSAACTVAQWDGFLHPGGTLAGFATTGGVTTAYFNEALTVTLLPTAPYGAYNPYNGDVVVGQADRVGYV